MSFKQGVTQRSGLIFRGDESSGPVEDYPLLSYPVHPSFIHDLVRLLEPICLSK